MIDSAFVYSGALRRRPTLPARRQGTQQTVGDAAGSIKQLNDLKRRRLEVELQSQEELHRMEVTRREKQAYHKDEKHRLRMEADQRRREEHRLSGGRSSQLHIQVLRAAW